MAGELRAQRVDWRRSIYEVAGRRWNAPGPAQEVSAPMQAKRMPFAAIAAYRAGGI